MTQLLGSNVDAGSNLTVNALTPRAWNFAVTANGNADTLFFKANNSTTYKFGVYAVASLVGTPTTLLATTGDIVATAGNVYSIALSTPIAMTVGQFYSLAAKPLGSGSIRGTASPTSNQRNSSTDATYADPLDSTWSNTGGASGSTPAIWLESTVNSITVIDKLNASETSTVTIAAAATAFTNLAITDSVSQLLNITSIAGSGTSWTFTAPQPVDNTAGLKYGTTSIVATTDGVDTADYTALDLDPVTGRSYVSITSVATGNILVGQTPALGVGDQFEYDPATCTIGADGIFTSDYTGTQTIKHYDATDYTWRFYTVDTVDGAVVVTVIGKMPILGIGYGIGI